MHAEKNQFIAKRKKLFNLIFARGKYEINDDDDKSKIFWFVCFQILIMLNVYAYLINQYPNRKILGDLFFIAAAILCGGFLELLFLAFFSSNFNSSKAAKNE